MADHRSARHLLRLRTEPRHGSVRLFASGEVELGTAGYLEEVLAELQRDRETVIVDLGDLTFMGACGIHIFTDAATRARNGDGSFTIENCSRPARRVFEVTASGSLLHGQPPAPYRSPATAAPSGGRSLTGSR